MTILEHVLRALDRAAPKVKSAAHIATGAAGEDAAHFFLKQQGYAVVARNWRPARSPFGAKDQSKDEIDLVGYEGDVLCFVEVKTRTSRAIPAEAAVDHEKQRALRRAARAYMRRLPSPPAARFDIVSVYLGPGSELEEVTLFRDAFPLT